MIPIGVSCIVRARPRHDEPSWHQAGKVGMVIGQARNGRDRYSIMFPGDTFAYSLAAADLEVLQGVDPEAWWRRPVSEKAGRP